MMKEIELARMIVKNAFRNKTDKGGVPYIEHLNRVSEAVPDFGMGSLKTIALLHDLLEDCPEWNEDSLRQLFSKEIVDSVVVLTRNKGEDYFDYINRIKEQGWATEVKKADLFDNLNVTRLDEITSKDVERIKKYHKAYKILTNK